MDRPGIDRPLRILSIDGGGIRGVIPAVILGEFERRTKLPASQLFDFIAGTSTGGILGLALTRPDPDDSTRPIYRARDVVQLYEHRGRDIFSRTIWKRLSSLDGTADEKYPAEGLESVLWDAFGETMLSEALVPVLVSSYEIERREPFFFKSWRAEQAPHAQDFPMRYVARATSAAPTYFEPLPLNTMDGSRTLHLIDGGVFANNPTMCAFVEALRQFSPKSEKVIVVSLGAGEITRSLEYERARHWGNFQWARHVVNIAFDGVDDAVDYQMNQLLNRNSKHQRYYRFQMDLHGANDDIDDATSVNIRNLKRLARAHVHERSKEVTGLCRLLRAPARREQVER